MPSNSFMESLDALYASKGNPGDDDLDQTVADPIEMHSRTHMMETGFDGRGDIPIRAPDLAYQLFLKTLRDDDDHTQLKLALSQAGTAAADKFLSKLFNPANKNRTIETLAKSCGIGIPQLRDIWRTARIDEGLMNLLNEYPRAMKDVARDSRSTREACKFCGGTGKIVDEHAEPPEVIRPRGRRRSKLDYDAPEPKPVLIACPNCKGFGSIRKVGDKDSRALMGQILGVSGKVAPLVDARTSIFNLESVIGDIEQMQKAQPTVYDIEPDPEDKPE
jgi:hypothetical protein